MSQRAAPASTLCRGAQHPPAMSPLVQGTSDHATYTAMLLLTLVSPHLRTSVGPHPAIHPFGKRWVVATLDLTSRRSSRGGVFVLLEESVSPAQVVVYQSGSQNCSLGHWGFQSLALNNALVCWGRDGCEETQGPINPTTHSGSLHFMSSKAKLLKV